MTQLLPLNELQGWTCDVLTDVASALAVWMVDLYLSSLVRFGDDNLTDNDEPVLGAVGRSALTCVQLSKGM